MAASPTGDLVSVVIASYNMGQYLPRAVHSALAQSYPQVEVLVVDDGSTDDTPAIMRQFHAEARVRALRQPNGGQARARNQGVAASRGQFVAFLDADDEWLPDKLARQMPLFRDRPGLGVVHSEFERMDADGQPLPRGTPVRMHRGRVSGPLLIENFVSFQTAVVRRECLERYGAFDESVRMGDDYELFLRLSAHYEFDFVPEATIRYRIWPGQMSKNYRRRYEYGIRTMQTFLERHPGLVEPSVVRTAWAHTYKGRGDCALWREQQWGAAFRDYLRALSFRPGYWPAWHSMLRSLITTRAPQ
jgi:glycosyltransferase involved in cell wall biosynthesis